MPEFKISIFMTHSLLVDKEFLPTKKKTIYFKLHNNIILVKPLCSSYTLYFHISRTVHIVDLT